MAHDVAVRVGRQLFAGAFGRIHHASPEEEQASFEYLAKHRDKQYSFVDCLSFVVMENLGIREAFAVDSDFTHRFVALPGPHPKVDPSGRRVEGHHLATHLIQGGADARH